SFPSNPSPPFVVYTISPLKGGAGLSDFQVGRVIGVMGSGEGYGVAVECTRDSGLELETVGKAGLGFGGKRVEVPSGCRFKREEWGRGKSAPPSFFLFSFHLAEILVIT
ncbi:hypothetical protein Tco_1550109, partial [Tanacetum coccineum]